MLSAASYRVWCGVCGVQVCALEGEEHALNVEE